MCMHACAHAHTVAERRQRGGALLHQPVPQNTPETSGALTTYEGAQSHNPPLQMSVFLLRFSGDEELVRERMCCAIAPSVTHTIIHT